MLNLEEIEKAIGEDSLDEASVSLDKTPEVPDNAARVRFLRGFLQERRHDVQAAMDSYQSVLETDADHQQCLFRLAYLTDLRGDDDAAIAYYERCTSEPPAHVNALINLGYLYEENHRLREARDCLTRVLDEYPEHPRARLFDKHLDATINMLYDDEASVRRRERDLLFDTPLTEFELSVRSRNCLKQMNLHTVGDLLSTSESELLNYKNFGETSLNEIKAMLTKKGLKVGQVLMEPADETPETPAPALTAPEVLLLSRPISELQLSVRSRRCLQRLGITFIEDLVSRSENELLSIKNFGLTSLNEIRRELAERGLGLRGSPR